jgi:hypothetical protein
VRGAVNLSVESKSAAPGQSVLIGFFASSNSGDVISGFNLPLDLGQSGQGFPAFIAYSATPIRNPAFEFVTLSTALNSAVNVDGIVNGDGDGLALGTTPTKLFDLELAIGSAVTALTTVPIVIVNPTSPANLFSIAGPNLPQVGGLQGGTLTIAPAQNADFDGNGFVDGRDFLIWQRSEGAQTGVTHQNGDATGDGAVTQADLNVWRGQFGQHNSLSGPLSVPEPTSLFIVITLFCAGRRFS